jgi:hypothetical protein
MGTDDQNGDIVVGWTPEKKLIAFKEGVTAVIGVILVGFTIHLARKAFGYVGDQAKISDAKDILMLMLGLAGVVVGYYFGRVPADARAAQAQEQANTATAQAEQVSAQAQSAADQVDNVLARLVNPEGATTPGIAAVPGTEDVVKDIKNIRAILRKV